MNCTKDVSKRLQSEVMGLVFNGIEGVKAFPERGNITIWKATITCKQDSLFPGEVFHVKINFPDEYPFTSPKVLVVSPIFHPNIDENGNICLDILKDKWSPIYNARTILLSLQQLLDDPNASDPLDARAAEIYEKGRKYFMKYAKKIIKRRKFPLEQSQAPRKQKELAAMNSEPAAPVPLVD